ncbi:NfeD family protein [Herbaspirillum sp. YR522]|uniref:NfeD family protein n=1 Tax=Herbaspirillum sp. YR522 TaxID=1144342 RepID=UPI00026FAB53|nr:NfeD family protein [Herbaspirillum sp. YR522]EJN00503.1 membrane protein implicated in regulation of membrane protease activity [Herbaspirillum sp. YR522]
MSDWSIWFVLAGVLIAAELFSGTFYLLMIALGLVAGGGLALGGALLEWQLLAAAAVGVAAVLGLRRSRFGRLRRGRANDDPNQLLDIGQTLEVPAWRQHGSTHVARVPYRGALWDVELEAGHAPVPGACIIREIRGSRLIVAPR